MNKQDMKVHYVILSDGSQLMGRMESADFKYKSFEIYDPCRIVMPTSASEMPRVRKWLPWVEDDKLPVMLITYSVTTVFPVMADMADWYDEMLGKINARAAELLAKLDEVGESRGFPTDMTEEEFLDQLDEDDDEHDPEADSEFDELLTEFFNDDKGTIH